MTNIRARTEHELEILAKDISINKGVPLPRDATLREAEIDRLAREGLPLRTP
jgi:hypothetical protein